MNRDGRQREKERRKDREAERRRQERHRDAERKEREEVRKMLLRGSCKKFCHWVRITSVLRFIKHIFITNL